MRDHADEHDADSDNDDDDDTGEGGADIEEGTSGDEDASPETTLPRARTKSRDVGPVSPFGGVPREATAWGVRKKTEVGTWTKDLEWSAPGATIALKEWPLSELSEGEVRRRWGAGSYQVHWLKSDARGVRGHIAYGRDVTILPAIEPAPSSPAAAPVADGGLAGALQLMHLLEQTAAERRAAVTLEANQTIAGMAQLAAVMQRNAGGGGGIDSATLATILRENREATIAAVREAVGADDEDDDGVTGAVVAAAAPMFKGKGTLSAILNFAQTNPTVAQKALETGLPLAVGLLQKLAEVVIPKPASAPPPPPPPPPPSPVVEQLPRAVPAPSSPQSPPGPKVISGLSAGSGLESVKPVAGEPSPA